MEVGGDSRSIEESTEAWVGMGRRGGFKDNVANSCVTKRFCELLDAARHRWLPLRPLDVATSGMDF